MPCDLTQRTPMHLTAIGSHTAVILGLMNREAKMDSSDVDQKTPLHHEASGGHITAIQV